MIQPYLIQRGLVVDNRHLHYKRAVEKAGSPNKVTLSGIVSFDTMGSAEFEFGAVSKAFKTLYETKDILKLWHHPTIERISLTNKRLTKDKRTMWVIGQETNQEEINTVILKLSNDKYLLKERTNLPQQCIGTRETPLPFVYERGHFSEDFWWDIENNFLFGFGLKNSERIWKGIIQSLIKLHELEESQ